jgi:hypothetical protein
MAPITYTPNDLDIARRRLRGTIVRFGFFFVAKVETLSIFLPDLVPSLTVRVACRRHSVNQNAGEMTGPLTDDGLVRCSMNIVR